MLTFVESKLFTSLVHKYLPDDEYAALQQALTDNPEAGDVMRGSGGVRKIRWGDCVARQARRDSGHLLLAASTGRNLDAHAVLQE